MAAYSSESSSSSAYSAPVTADLLAITRAPGYLPGEARGENEYLASLLMPAARPECIIPDTSMAQAVCKTLRFDATFSGRTQYLVMVRPQNTTTANVLVFRNASVVPGQYDWRLDRVIPPDQDIAEDYFKVRFGSAQFSIVSSTQATGSALIGGQLTTVAFQDMIDFQYLAPEAIAATRKDDYSSIDNYPIAKGAVYTSDPSVNNQYLSPDTAVVMTTGTIFDLTAQKVPSQEMGAGPDPFVAVIASDTHAYIYRAGRSPTWDNSANCPLPPYLDGRTSLHYDLMLDDAPIINRFPGAFVRVIFYFQDGTSVTGDSVFYSWFTATQERLSGSYTYTCDTSDGLTGVEIELFRAAGAGGTMLELVNALRWTTSLKNCCYLYPGQSSDGCFFAITGVTDTQQIVLSGVINYQAIPNASLARNMKTVPPPVEMIVDAEVARRVIANRAHYGIRTVYQMDDYEFKMRHGYFASLCQRETLLAKAWSWSDLLRGVQSAVKTFRPVIDAGTSMLPAMWRKPVSAVLDRIEEHKFARASGWRRPSRPARWSGPSKTTSRTRGTRHTGTPPPPPEVKVETKEIKEVKATASGGVTQIGARFHEGIDDGLGSRAIVMNALRRGFKFVNLKPKLTAQSGEQIRHFASVFGAALVTDEDTITWALTQTFICDLIDFENMDDIARYVCSVHRATTELDFQIQKMLKGSLTGPLKDFEMLKPAERLEFAKGMAAQCTEHKEPTCLRCYGFIVGAKIFDDALHRDEKRAMAAALPSEAAAEVKGALAETPIEKLAKQVATDGPAAVVHVVPEEEYFELKYPNYRVMLNREEQMKIAKKRLASVATDDKSLDVTPPPVVVQRFPVVIGDAKTQSAKLYSLMLTGIPFRRFNDNPIVYSTYQVDERYLMIDTTNLDASSIAQVKLAFQHAHRLHRGFITADAEIKVAGSSIGLAAYALMSGYPDIGPMSGEIAYGRFGVVFNPITEVMPKLSTVHGRSVGPLICNYAEAEPGLDTLRAHTWWPEQYNIGRSPKEDYSVIIVRTEGDLSSLTCRFHTALGLNLKRKEEFERIDPVRRAEMKEAITNLFGRVPPMFQPQVIALLNKVGNVTTEVQLHKVFSSAQTLSRIIDDYVTREKAYVVPEVAIETLDKLTLLKADPEEKDWMSKLNPRNVLNLTEQETAALEAAIASSSPLDIDEIRVADPKMLKLLVTAILKAKKTIDSFARTIGAVPRKTKKKKKEEGKVFRPVTPELFRRANPVLEPLAAPPIRTGAQPRSVPIQRRPPALAPLPRAGDTPAAGYDPAAATEDIEL